MVHLVESPEFVNHEFAERQTAYCGVPIVGRGTWYSRISRVTCPDCIKKHFDVIRKPFDCEDCHKILDMQDTQALSPRDYKRQCIQCKEKENH